MYSLSTFAANSSAMHNGVAEYRLFDEKGTTAMNSRFIHVSLRNLIRSQVLFWDLFELKELDD